MEENMINRKNLLLLLLFSVIIIGTISAVSANDLNDTDVQTSINEEIALEQDNEGEVVLEQNNNQEDNILNESNSKQEILTDGPESFSKLYETINNNTDSEIVLACNYTYNSETDGNYRMGVPITRNVTIDGRGCIIDGGSIAKGFSIDNCNVLIKNITFVHLGQYSNSNSNYNGGAIFSKFYANPTTSVKVVDSTFNGCKGYWGGALYNVEAENCVFTQNSACYAGAMYMTSAKDCTFKQNSAVSNGGACYNVASDHCTFISNSAASYNNGNGGGQYRGTATNCEFRQNSAKYGGGFYGSSSSDYALNCKFISNTATNGAGAYGYSSSSRVELVNCEFRSNEAYNNYGGSYNCKRVLCTYTSNKAKNYPNYDSSSPTGSAQMRVPSSCEVKYPSPVEIPVNITYTTSSGKLLQIVKSVSISLYKDGIFQTSYSCMSGSTWVIDLERGSYRATFSGGSSSASCNINVCVNKTKISVNGTNEMLQFEDEYLIATLTNLTGSPLADFNVSVSNGQGYSEIFTTDENGRINVSLKNISYGYYQFTIQSEGTEYYEPSTAYHIINIRRIYVTINSADTLNTYYNKTSTLTGNLTDEYGNLFNDYNLTVSINDLNFQVSVEGDQFKIEIPTLEPKKYQMYVGFDGNKTHGNTYKIVNVQVNRIPTEVTSENIYAYYKEGKVTAKIKDQFGDALTDFDLNLFIGNNFIQSLKTNDAGEVEFDLGSIDNGTYDAIVSYNGTNHYLYSFKEIKLKIGKLDTKITSDGLTVIYCENGTLIAYLTDINGNNVKNADMRFEIGQFNKTLKTDENGKAVLNFTDEIPVGKYSGTIYFDGDGRYKTASKAVQVNINSIPTEITATNLTCYYNETAYIIVTLKDKYGNPLINKTVEIKASGLTFTGTTNETGQANISIKLPAKTYKATVIYAGNGTYEASSNTTDIIIYKVDKIQSKVASKSISTTYNVNKYLVVTVTDINGTLITNKQVNIVLNGKTSILTTNSQGQVKLATSGLKPGKYDAKITCPGDDKYIGSSYSVKILVKKVKPKFTAAAKKIYTLKATKKYSIVLKNNKNQVLKNKKVTVKFSGKTYVAKTDSKGKATFTFTKLTKKGTYKTVLSFAGDSCYNKLNKFVTFIVK